VRDNDDKHISNRLISQLKNENPSKKKTILPFKEPLLLFLPENLCDTESLSNSPNPPAPFPEREGGDIFSAPLSFQGRGRGRGALIANLCEKACLIRKNAVLSFRMLYVVFTKG